jgi:hypothetical protein
MLGGSFVTTAWWVVILQMEGQPPAMKVISECIEKSAVDKLQGVVLQLGGWVWV